MFFVTWIGNNTGIRVICKWRDCCKRRFAYAFDGTCLFRHPPIHPPCKRSQMSFIISDRVIFKSAAWLSIFFVFRCRGFPHVNFRTFLVTKWNKMSFRKIWRKLSLNIIEHCWTRGLNQALNWFEHWFWKIAMPLVLSLYEYVDSVLNNPIKTLDNVYTQATTNHNRGG